MTDASADILPLMTVLDGADQPHNAPGGVSEAVFNAALRGWVKGHLAAPGQRVSGNTNEPIPSPALRPRDSHALVAPDGFRGLAGGAKVE
jgi:hypothetical protein